MQILNGSLALIALEAVTAFAYGAELQPAAQSAWQAYVRTADMHMQTRADAGAPFLWLDEAPSRKRCVRDGAILVLPGTGNGTQAVPGGLIHHWVAAVFILHANLADVLRVVHNYADYKQFYQPAIMDSRLLGCAEGYQSFSMRSLHRVLFVTAVLDSQFVTRDFPMDAKHWYIVADATRVQEVENYGRTNEHVLPPDHGRGFIWRFHTISRYEERDGGVYFEMEVIALSRDIPASLRWLVEPGIARFSQSELMAWLRRKREAVTAAAGAEHLVNWSLAGERSPVR